jgi:DNA-binding HxlR family transcriptional regulator
LFVVTKKEAVLMMRKTGSTNYENEQTLKVECPFVFALSLIGKRWKPAILWKLTRGVNRFGGLKREIPPITEKMLTQHLRELERDGLITRTTFEDAPQRVEYALTTLGQSLEPVLAQLGAWGEMAMASANSRQQTER